MAIYDYSCPICQYSVEILGSVQDHRKPVYCVNCEVKMLRVYSISDPVFKGSGFYSTDKKE
nr:MAG TPA: LysW biosynthesis protein LysW [Caudoviricetes sp.]